MSLSLSPLSLSEFVMLVDLEMIEIIGDKLCNALFNLIFWCFGLPSRHLVGKHFSCDLLFPPWGKIIFSLKFLRNVLCYILTFEMPSILGIGYLLCFTPLVGLQKEKKLGKSQKKLNSEIWRLNLKKVGLNWPIWLNNVGSSSTQTPTWRY